MRLLEAVSHKKGRKNGILREWNALNVLLCILGEVDAQSGS